MKEQIIEIVKRLSGIKNEQINSNAKIKELGIDSLTFTEIIMEIEDKLNVEIDAKLLFSNEMGDLTLLDLFDIIGANINEVQLSSG